MRLQELLAGREPDLGLILDEARARVKKEPGNAEARVFLFQALCVAMQWDKAGKQLESLSTLAPQHALFAKFHEPIVACERLRAEVFEGKRSPLVFGEPDQSVALAIQALKQYAEGHAAAARELTMQAFDAIPAVGGNLNGDTPFEWLADADQRIGPIFEIITNGKYYWLPMSLVQVIAIDPPEDLRDAVWIGAQLKLRNGAEIGGVIPTRYPADYAALAPGLALARATEWQDMGGEVFFGLGQRLFATEGGDHAILETRKIEFAAV